MDWNERTSALRSPQEVLSSGQVAAKKAQQVARWHLLLENISAVSYQVTMWQGSKGALVASELFRGYSLVGLVWPNTEELISRPLMGL